MSQGAKDVVWLTDSITARWTRVELDVTRVELDVTLVRECMIGLLISTQQIFSGNFIKVLCLGKRNVATMPLCCVTGFYSNTHKDSVSFRSIWSYTRSG